MLEQAHVFTSRGRQLVAIEHIPRSLSEQAPELTPELISEVKSKKKISTQGIIIVVGGPQTRVGSHRLFVLLSRALAKQGIHVFRFDYTGAGDSEGDVTSFTDIQADISEAVNYFKQKQPQLTTLSLWGLCDAASAILLYLAQYPNDSAAIHRLILVNPWVSQTHTAAQTYLTSYYFNRFFSQDFWKKLFTGKINTRKTLNEVHGFQQQSKQPAEKNNFVDQMYQGLRDFRGQTYIALSGNDLTADEFILLVKNSDDWNKLMADNKITTDKIKLANHTFSAQNSQQLLIKKTFKALLSG